MFLNKKQCSRRPQVGSGRASSSMSLRLLGLEVYRLPPFSERYHLEVLRACDLPLRPRGRPGLQEGCLPVRRRRVDHRPTGRARWGHLDRPDRCHAARPVCGWCGPWRLPRGPAGVDNRGERKVLGHMVYRRPDGDSGAPEPLSPRLPVSRDSSVSLSLLNRRRRFDPSKS